MKTEQKIQFDAFGCACRCLIKLCEMHGKPISEEKFLSVYFERYRTTWEKKCGGTMTSMVIDIARELELCTDADTRTDQQFVVSQFGKTFGILAITDREKHDAGTFRPNYHCRLIQGRAAADVWELWEPYSDGTSGDCVPRSFAELEKEGVHFLLLYWVELCNELQ